MTILKVEVDRRAFKYFMAKMYTVGTEVCSSKLYTCSTFPLEIISDATLYVHTTFVSLADSRRPKQLLKRTV